MGLLSSLNEKIEKYQDLTAKISQTSTSTSKLVESSTPLTSKDVFRYRRIRGVNLGSWFTLEPWIVNTPFTGAVPPKGSDLDVAKGKNAQEILERHWDSWMQEEDWEWLANKGINTVRIPIGYYHLCGGEPSVLDGTDFEDFAHVYRGAWRRIQAAIQTAGKYGFGVLIDLHAAAGAQNRDPHSGTSTGQIHLWESKANRRSTSTALKFLVKEFASVPHCTGVELLNEPANNGLIQEWYQSTLSELRAIPGAQDFPLYIADAWDLPWYSKFVGERSDFVIVDHHLYRCFTEDEKRLSGEEHAQNIRTVTSGQLADMSQKARGNIIVGEWSAGLHIESLRSNDPGEQDRQRRVFVRAQLDCYEAHTAGWFFWTYKKGEGWDAGWSMKNAMLAEILPNSFGRKRNPGLAWNEDTKNEAMRSARDAHKDYWRGQGIATEIWKFEAGYTCGWGDAWLFESFAQGRNVSELGFRPEWVKRRMEEYAQRNGPNNNWEFEHGFNQAFDAAVSSFHQ